MACGRGQQRNGGNAETPRPDRTARLKTGLILVLHLGRILQPRGQQAKAINHLAHLVSTRRVSSLLAHSRRQEQMVDGRHHLLTNPSNDPPKPVDLEDRILVSGIIIAHFAPILAISSQCKCDHT